MVTTFVTRHEAAVEWAIQQGFQIDAMVSHFDPNLVREGDLVLGTLPVHLAAEVCKRGGRYYHLILDLPAEARGKELSVEDMERFGARLERYTIAPERKPNEDGDRVFGPLPVYKEFFAVELQGTFLIPVVVAEPVGSRAKILRGATIEDLALPNWQGRDFRTDSMEFVTGHPKTLEEGRAWLKSRSKGDRKIGKENGERP